MEIVVDNNVVAVVAQAEGERRKYDRILARGRMKSFRFLIYQQNNIGFLKITDVDLR